jgi:dihydroxyacetone kinase-like protein
MSTVEGSEGMPIDGAAVRAYVERCRTLIRRHAGYLTRLDATLGDGDHGDNMVIGFDGVAEMLSSIDPSETPGALLRAIGHRLVASVGGASGPLYGTAFIEAGIVAGARETLDPELIGAMLGGAASAVARRGRCVVGDKTIYDALAPAATAYRAALPGATNAGPALAAAARAAWRGFRATRPLVARRGLALRLGDRSRGHLDPGAASCFLLVRALAPQGGARREAAGRADGSKAAAWR